MIAMPATSNPLSVTAHVFACTKCGMGNDLFVLPPKKIFVCRHCSSKSKMIRSLPIDSESQIAMWAIPAIIGVIGAMMHHSLHPQKIFLSAKQAKNYEEFLQENKSTKNKSKTKNKNGNKNKKKRHG